MGERTLSEDVAQDVYLEAWRLAYPGAMTGLVLGGLPPAFFRLT
jgi:hypothetical protein